MSKTEIQWTDYSWNPVTGCTKVSPACAHCYAESIARRFAGTPSWPNGFAVTCHEDRLGQPLHWRTPRKVFLCSAGDLFHLDVPNKFICAVFGIMAFTPQHTHQVLTKRAGQALGWYGVLDRLAEQAREVFPDESLNWRRWHVLRAAAIFYTGRPLPSIPEDPPWPLPNVWIGSTVENQEYADARIPLLLQVPAAVRFVSLEPMLSAINLEPYLWLTGPSTAGPWRDCLGRKRGGGGIGGQTMSAIPSGDIGWVIVGGETGAGARPMHPDWARSLRDQCQAAGVPFFFKQHGEWAAIDQPAAQGSPAHLATTEQWLNLAGGQGFHGQAVWRMRRVGKKAAGHLLDGREWQQFPETARG